MDQEWIYDVLVFGDTWPWFHAPTGKDGGAWGVYLRCPACGSVIDWRDQGTHLRFHGIANSDTIGEIQAAQKSRWEAER